VAAALSMALSVPALASASVLGGVVDQVTNAVTGVTSDGGGGSASPEAGTPPDYVPPLHGTDPHGEGTVGVVDLTPEDTAPLGSDPAGGDPSNEEIVVGRSVGSQDPSTGEYHGHVTVAALFGQEIIGVDTTEGETAAGPLDPVQTQILDAICDGSQNQICLTVLAADSSTDESGSTNHFAVAEAQIGGPTGINAGVAESNGNISDDGSCQTASGDSTVADASIGTALTADALNSTTESQACNDGSQSTENTSQVVNLQGHGLPVPTQGCEDGTPNTNFDVLAPLLSAVCNADDTSGTQADSPYGVREALSLFVLDLGGVPLVKTTTAGSESAATAPGITCPGDPECPPPCPDPANPQCPPCDNPPCGNGGGNKGQHHGGNRVKGERGGNGNGGGPTAKAGNGLPFTGSDLLTLGLIGFGVMGLGLGGMALADRRRTWLVR
jgi:hypothetical protein